jgi:hypothetical protein
VLYMEVHTDVLHISMCIRLKGIELGVPGVPSRTES